MRNIVMLTLVALAFAAVMMSGTTGCKPAAPRASVADTKPSETGSASGGGKITWLTDHDAALKQAKADNKPVMIDVYADWCGWCKKLDEDTWPDAKVAKLADKFVCLKLDADAHKDLEEKYAPEGLPTVVFLRPTGETITSQVGYAKPDEMLAVVQKALGQ